MTAREIWDGFKEFFIDLPTRKRTIITKDDFNLILRERDEMLKMLIYIYNNEPFDGLEKLIERATGKPIEEVIK